MNRADVRPEYRSTKDETWSQYLRRVFPHLADILLIRDSGARSRAITEVEEQFYFARQSWDYCHDEPSWCEAVEDFLRDLYVDDGP